MASGPPNKIVSAGSLASYTNPTDTANAISDAEQTFYNTFGVWPNQVLVYKDELYLGAYQ